MDLFTFSVVFFTMLHQKYFYMCFQIESHTVQVGLESFLFAVCKTIFYPSRGVPDLEIFERSHDLMNW